MKRAIRASAVMLSLGAMGLVISSLAANRAAERLCAQYGGLRVQSNYRPPNFFFEYPPITEKKVIYNGNFPPYKKENISSIGIISCKNSSVCKSHLQQENPFSFVDKINRDKITIFTNTGNFICKNSETNVKLVSKQCNSDKYLFLQYSCPISYLKNDYGISEMRYLARNNEMGYFSGLEYSFEDYLVYDTFFYKVYYSGWFLKRPENANPAVSYAEFGTYSLFNELVGKLFTNPMGIFANKSSNYCGAPVEAERISDAAGSLSLPISSFGLDVAYKPGVQMEMRR